MAEQSWWETIRVKGAQLYSEIDQVVQKGDAKLHELSARIERMVQEGNVRRIVIKQGTRVVAEFPLTVGVVGAMLAPVLAAIGAIVALLSECTIEVEHVERGPSADDKTSGQKGQPKP